MEVNISIYIYICLGILDFEGEVHSIWYLWIGGLQESKGNGFFKVGRVGNNFRSTPKKLDVLDGRLPRPNLCPPKSLWGEV